MTTQPANDDWPSYVMPSSTLQRVRSQALAWPKRRMFTLSLVLLVNLFALLELEIALIVTAPIGLALLWEYRNQYGIDHVVGIITTIRDSHKPALYDVGVLGETSGKPIVVESLPLYTPEIVQGGDLGVLYDPVANTHTVCIQIVSWRGMSSSDPSLRLMLDHSFTTMLERLTNEGLFTRFGYWTMRRSAVSDEALHYVDEMTAGSGGEPEVMNLQESIEELVAMARSSDTIFTATLRAPSHRRVRKLVESGKWKDVPTTKAAERIRSEFESFGIVIGLPSSEQLSALCRQLVDPVDTLAATEAQIDTLVRKGKRLASPRRRVMGPLSTQQGIYPVTTAHNKYLQCGESVHAFLSTAKFDRRLVPAGSGFFDEAFMGMTPWSVVGLIASVRSKTAEVERNKRLAQHRRDKAYARARRGTEASTAQRLKEAEMLEARDEVELASGGFPWWSFVFMISAPDVEALEEQIGVARQLTSSHLDMHLQRVTGKWNMEPALKLILGGCRD